MEYCAILWKYKDPVAPNKSAIPNRRKAEANDPIRKYFIAASLEAMDFFSLPASRYNEIDIISNPIKKFTRFPEEIITKAPITENSIILNIPSGA